MVCREAKAGTRGRGRGRGRHRGPRLLADGSSAFKGTPRTG